MTRLGESCYEFAAPVLGRNQEPSDLTNQVSTQVILEPRRVPLRRTSPRSDNADCSGCKANEVSFSVLAINVGVKRSDFASFAFVNCGVCVDCKGRFMEFLRRLLWL